MKFDSRKVSAILSAAALAASVAAVKAAEPEDAIKYRKNVMDAIGGHTAALFAINGNKAGDAGHLEAHVRSLAATAMTVKDIFPPDSDFGETRAKSEIWSEPEEFAEKVAELEDAASGVLSAYESNGDMGAALNNLGQSCKGCHDEFRSKD